MGGRGSAGGEYGHLPRSTLEKMQEKETVKLREAQHFAHRTINKIDGNAVARRIRSDTKKYDKAFDELRKIEKALKVAGKRKNEPF